MKMALPNCKPPQNIVYGVLFGDKHALNQKAGGARSGIARPLRKSDLLSCSTTWEATTTTKAKKTGNKVAKQGNCEKAHKPHSPNEIDGREMCPLCFMWLSHSWQEIAEAARS